MNEAVRVTSKMKSSSGYLEEAENSMPALSVSAVHWKISLFSHSEPLQLENT